MANQRMNRRKLLRLCATGIAGTLWTACTPALEKTVGVLPSSTPTMEPSPLPISTTTPTEIPILPLEALATNGGNVISGVWAPPTLEQAKYQTEGGALPEYILEYQKHLKDDLREFGLRAENVVYSSNGQAGNDSRWALWVTNASGYVIQAYFADTNEQLTYPLYYENKNGEWHVVDQVSGKQIEYRNSIKGEGNSIVGMIWGGDKSLVPIYAENVIDWEGNQVYARYWNPKSQQWELSDAFVEVKELGAVNINQADGRTLAIDGNGRVLAEHKDGGWKKIELPGRARELSDGSGINARIENNQVIGYDFNGEFVAAQTVEQVLYREGRQVDPYINDNFVFIGDRFVRKTVGENQAVDVHWIKETDAETGEEYWRVTDAAERLTPLEVLPTAGIGTYLPGGSKDDKNGAVLVYAKEVEVQMYQNVKGRGYKVTPSGDYVRDDTFGLVRYDIDLPEQVMSGIRYGVHGAWLFGVVIEPKATGMDKAVVTFVADEYLNTAMGIEAGKVIALVDRVKNGETMRKLNIVTIYRNSFNKKYVGGYREQLGDVISYYETYPRYSKARIAEYIEIVKSIKSNVPGFKDAMIMGIEEELSEYYGSGLALSRWKTGTMIGDKDYTDRPDNIRFIKDEELLSWDNKTSIMFPGVVLVYQ